MVELTTTPSEVASIFSESNYMEVGGEILPPRTTNPTSKSMAARIWEDNVKMSFESLVGSENSLQERTAGGVTLVADAVVVVNVVNPVAWCIVGLGLILASCDSSKDTGQKLQEGEICEQDSDCAEGLYCMEIYYDKPAECLPLRQEGEFCGEDDDCEEEGSICLNGVMTVAVGVHGYCWSPGE